MKMQLSTIDTCWCVLKEQTEVGVEILQEYKNDLIWSHKSQIIIVIIITIICFSDYYVATLSLVFL